MTFQPLLTDDGQQLDVIWMPNGLPLFAATHENLFELVESMGFSIYYVLGNEAITKTNTYKGANGVSTTSTSTTLTSGIYKVVNNFIGRAVAQCDDPFPEEFLATVTEETTYSMPPIPRVLLDKLDEFFRLVDTKHGTESIVLLTYDTTKTGPDGWGVLVPDQTNTSVHCNYDPTSIIEHKPDDALIVGSVHSHPHMAAYASGTDHHDQADFDGVHITFGWQKTVNNGATQYHIEMQMAGSTYTLKPEDVFETIDASKEPDPEVVQWAENVKKVLPPQSKAGATSTPIATSKVTSTPPPASTTRTTPGTKSTAKSATVRFEDLPDVWQTMGTEAILLGEVIPNHLGAFSCPACQTTLSDTDILDGHCYWCLIPVISKVMAEKSTLDDIYSDVAYWCYLYDFTTDARLYMWITNGGSENTLMPLTNGTLAEALRDVNLPNPSIETTYYDESTPPSSYDREHLICCGLRFDDSDECACAPQMTPNDMIDFDTHLSSVNIYQTYSQCNTCEFYYDVRCPGYRSSLAHFVDNRTLDPQQFADLIDGQGCPMFEYYSTASYASVYDAE